MIKLCFLGAVRPLFHLLPFNLTPCIHLGLLFHRSITGRITGKGKDYKLGEYWRINLELTFNTLWRALHLLSWKLFSKCSLADVDWKIWRLYSDIILADACVCVLFLYMPLNVMFSLQNVRVYYSVASSVPLHVRIPHNICSCDWARPSQPSRLSDGGGGDRQYSPAGVEPRQRQRQPHHQLPHSNPNSLHCGLAEG